MTLLANVPLPKIHVHQSNPRFNAVADDELVASVVAVGILTPVTLAPDGTDPDGYVLIGGHRRLDAARRAGLPALPALVRADLATEAQQVEAMLVENLHRVDLTPVEEAAAYEQLTLFGMDPAAIAAATGRRESTIRARIRLARLPDAAKLKVHEGEATLQDAEDLLEFTNHPDLLADLEAHLGTVNFRWKVSHARDQLRRADANQRLLDGLIAAGAVLTPRGTWARTGTQWPLYQFTEADLQETSSHQGCLGVVVDDASQFSQVTTVCTNPGGHEWVQPSSSDRAAVAAVVENETARGERLARAADLDAAAAARVEWLTGYWRTRLAALKAKSLVPGLRALFPVLIQHADISPWWPRFAQSVGLVPADTWADQLTQMTAYANSLPNAPAAQIIDALAAFLAAWTDEALADDGNLDDPDIVPHQAILWTWFEGERAEAGVGGLSDIDTELRDLVVAAATEAVAGEAS